MSPTDKITIDDAGGRESIALTLSPLSPEHAATLGARFSTIEPWVVYPYSASALQSYFAARETDAPRYAIHTGTTLIGALGLRHAWLRGPYIQFLGIFPEHQASGTGARVLAWIERQARTQGQRNLWVAASAFNTGALRFYERHGFVNVATLDGLVQDDRDEVLLRKRLL